MKEFGLRYISSIAFRTPSAILTCSTAASKIRSRQPPNPTKEEQNTRKKSPFLSLTHSFTILFTGSLLSFSFRILPDVMDDEVYQGNVINDLTTKLLSPSHTFIFHMSYLILIVLFISYCPKCNG